MRKSKFTEDRIAFALKKAELGISVEEVCRKMWASAMRRSMCGARIAEALARHELKSKPQRAGRTGTIEPFAS